MRDGNTVLQKLVPITFGVTISVAAQAGIVELTAPQSKIDFFLQNTSTSLHTAGHLSLYDNNTYVLRNSTFLLNDGKWSSLQLSPSNANYSYAKSGNGQCVDFAKIMSGNFLSTSNWMKGNFPAAYWQPDALKGKVIARFTCNSNTKYCSDGSNGAHVAVIIAAEKTPGSNTVTHAWIVDQNVVPFININTALTQGGSVAKRKISIYDSGVNNLNSYNIVNVFQ